MNLKRINKYLRIYQLIGFTLSFIVISVFSLRDSSMGIFIVLMMIPASLPFLIVSIFCLIKREKYTQIIKNSIYFSSGILVLSSLSLPFFYEWEGFFIMLGCCFLFIIILLNKKNLESQLIIFNSLGSVFLSTAFYAVVWAWLNWN